MDFKGLGWTRFLSSVVNFIHDRPGKHCAVVVEDRNRVNQRRGLARCERGGVRAA